MQFIVDLTEHSAKVKTFMSPNHTSDGFKLFWHSLPREDALIASRYLVDLWSSLFR